MRKFKNLRTGKYCSQASHASLGSYLKVEKLASSDNKIRIILNNWFQNSFKKIVLCVETEEEILELHKQLEDINIPNVVITDSGLTEFGVPTVTALGIGPWLEEELDEVTRHLLLF